MNFGDILDEWEKETAKPYGKKRLARDERAETDRRGTETDKGGTGGEGDAGPEIRRRAPKEQPRANAMDVWLRRYGTSDKDAAFESSPEALSPAERRRRLRALRPEASIDLHGLTRDEAWYRLEAFFADCSRRGLKKVLIIHGKGNHSEADPVLAPTVRLFLERNPHAGQSGPSDHANGGTGSTWVILK